MTSVNRAAKKEFWQSLLAEKDQSSLSAAEGCKEKDVSLQSVYQWRRRLQQPEGSVSKATSLLPVRVVPPANPPLPSTIQIVTASGVFLRLDSNTPHAQIASLIKAIDSNARGEA